MEKVKSALIQNIKKIRNKFYYNRYSQSQEILHYVNKKTGKHFQNNILFTQSFYAMN